MEPSRALALLFLVTISWHAAADETAHANSQNWIWYKYHEQNSGSAGYSIGGNALASTFSYEAQAWNEGGTSGLKTLGPQGKFNNVGGSPAHKSWPTFYDGQVPTPGTTKATTSFVGSGSDSTGILNALIVSRYIAVFAAFAEVDKSTIPAGGFGRAKATIKDPWSIDVPIANPGDFVDMFTILELTGSSMDTSDSLTSGSLNWHVSLDGISEYQSYLFDYTVTDDSTNFSSTLLAAPGVQIFLNDMADWSEGADWTDAVEFDPATQVTAAELKTYLDSFETTGGGWSLGATPVRIGLQFTIPNEALGIAGEPGMRHFLLHQDSSSEVMASVPIPENGTLTFAALGLAAFGAVVRLRRRRPSM